MTWVRHCVFLLSKFLFIQLSILRDDPLLEKFDVVKCNLIDLFVRSGFFNELFVRAANFFLFRCGEKESDLMQSKIIKPITFNKNQ